MFSSKGNSPQHNQRKDSPKTRVWERGEAGTDRRPVLSSLEGNSGGELPFAKPVGFTCPGASCQECFPEATGQGLRAPLRIQQIAYVGILEY